MFKLLNQRRAQSTLEYAILIVIVIGALIAMNTYIKRGLQGRFRSASDDIGDQYSPGNTNVVMNTVVSATQTETFTGGVSRTDITAEKTSVDGIQQIMNSDWEYYGVESSGSGPGGPGGPPGP